MTAYEFRMAREQMRYTQQYLAYMLGVERNTVSRYETGRRPVPGPVEILMERMLTNRLKARRKYNGTVRTGRVMTWRSSRKRAKLPTLPPEVRLDQ